MKTNQQLQSKGYTRGVTKPQFKRVLDYVGLSLTPQELQVLKIHITADMYM